jgi:hypothetical protein
VKRRFLRFSLRGLLGLVALVCLALGGRHLLDVYGDRIDVLDARVGETIHVRARRVRFLGPPKQLFDLQIDRPETGQFWFFYRWAERSWGFLYTVDAEFRPISTQGDLTVTLYENKETDPRLAGEGRWRVIKQQQLELNGPGPPPADRWSDGYSYEGPEPGLHDGRGYGVGPLKKGAK